MGRKRKNPADNRLPAGVYLAKGRYVYRKWADGKLSKETVLCPADAPISQIWQAYEALQTAAAPAKTLAWLMNQYLQSAKHQALAPRTRKDYAAYAAKIAAAKLKNGATFGDIEARPQLIKNNRLRLFIFRLTACKPLIRRGCLSHFRT